ncbi:MAG TPA: ABC transporter, partial [Acidimicrobiia bacterium]|nr:ABC transporter [Acidimicrobiia bacterium]
MTALQTLPFIGWRRPQWRLVERHALAYRRMWYIFLSGFAEPLFFLLSIGNGVGELVGTLRIGDHVVDYRTFVAPGLLATTAM